MYRPRRLHPHYYSCICALFCLLTGSALTHADNRLHNGQFESWDSGRPTGWELPATQNVMSTAGSGGEGQALKVEVKTAIQGEVGEIRQPFTIQPRTRYRLSGQMKGPAGMGSLQVILYRKGEAYTRIRSKPTLTPDWTPVEFSFETADCDSAEAVLSWAQETDHIGQSVAFDKLSITELGPLVYEGEEVTPRAIATFNSVGLYWKPAGGTASRSVNVHYRKLGDTTWSEALPLWFDDNEHDGEATKHTAEYRGSIVYLESGTEYEAKLSLENGPTRTVRFTTRSDDFKIARKVTLPSSYSKKFEIFEGGSEEDGYVLYEPAKGATAVWDGGHVIEHNLEIKASYVIVRGLTLRNARTHGIYLDDVHDVVIDQCDISGWGDTMQDGQARNLNAAIYARTPVLERIVVQNCTLHHPRSDSNSWNEVRPGTKSRHPEGPQGIVFYGGKGGHVIRNNRIYSDMEHMFNDGMGEVHNFSYGGFPVRDSDIHDNFISHCWDDALEIEGANMNVRVWNNYIDMTYGAIGAAVPSLGPVYFFRNVYAVSRKDERTRPNDLTGHYLIKIGNESAQWSRGRMYIFHNTILQPPPFPGSKVPSSGAQAGIVYTSDRKKQKNIVSRNNVFHMRSERDWAIKDPHRNSSNDFDYDLYDGQTRFKEGSQTHGIQASPQFERAPDGRLWLAPGAPGHDAGERLPNFNDHFTGQAPDMGAVEYQDPRPKPTTWPDFPPARSESQASSQRKNSSTFMSTAEQTFDRLNQQSWKLAMHDSGCDDWQTHWTLDGTQCAISNTPDGMEFKSGSEAGDHSNHGVLWTRARFSGDMKVSFDFTRLDSVNRYVCIAYFHANGIGEGAYTKDIHSWAHLREVPYMKTYFENMDLLHVSFAAFGNTNDDPEDYIRARRYPVRADRSFDEIEIGDTVDNTGLFTPGKTYSMTFIKTRDELALEVTGGERPFYHSWDISKVEPTTDGLFGIRQMWQKHSRYKNIRIYTK